MLEMETTHKDSRKIELCLEEKIQAYTRLAQRLSTNALEFRRSYDIENPADQMTELGLARDIEHLLSQLSDCVKSMESSGSRIGGRAKNEALLQRSRDLLHEYRTEYSKAAASIQSVRESYELFKGHRRIDDVPNGDKEHLLRERGAINSSLRSAANTLGQAHETRENLRIQRDILSRTTNTLESMVSNFPGISRLIDSIRRYKTRDNMIIASVIAFCMCFLI